jgi:hypothetical protein
MRDVGLAVDGLALAPDHALRRAVVLKVVVGALPWLLALGVAVVVLLQTGTPVLAIGRYGAYWCLGVTLPGVLIVRAAVGTRGNWPEDLALGAVTGLALELLFFALWSVAGLQQQLWLWPALVAVTFAAVPGLRRHWRISSPAPLPRLWSWGVASAIGLCAVNMRQAALTSPLPPAGGVYYQDVPWHLSIVRELTRSFPPQIPQVAGEVLRYHWFSDVHMAAAHLVSGVPATTVVLRLWILPLLAVTALIGARLARELSGVWWSGPVVAWGLVVFEGTRLLPRLGEPDLGEAGVIFPTSPSQVFLLPLVLGAAILIVRALRGLRLGAAGWAVLALLLVATAGAKPTAMPLILAGAGLAGVSLLVQRRRQWRAAVTVGAMAAVILPLSFLAVSGSGAGSTINLFDFVKWQPIYHSLTAAGLSPAAGTVPPGATQHLSGQTLVTLVILLLVPLVANLARLAPFGWIGSRRLRKDPAAWFMAGVLIAGWVVYLVLSHPFYSQAYFLRLANPLVLVFGAWALTAAIPATVRGGRRVAAVLAAGTLIGAGVVALARAFTPTMPGPTELSASRESLMTVATAFFTPLVVVFVAALVGLAGWVVARSKAPGLRGWGSALVLAALILGGPAQGSFGSSGEAVASFVANKPLPEGPRYRISPSGGAAMAWVDQHVPGDAVIATNRHCVAGRQRPTCHLIAFWVSGLGGRRTVLEGWGYLNDMTSRLSPSPFPERLAVNDAVFTHPSAATVDRLRRGYGATWLVADTSVGPVSPKLVRFAVPRFSSGPVTVYELR